MKKIYYLLVLLLPFNGFSQGKKITENEIAVNQLITGTLYTPENASKKTNLVILIAGSGPTDRNGNQSGTENNSLKFLSLGLAKNDIAVYSYDKRIIGQMANGTVDEKTLSFDDFIQDAKDVVSYFKIKKQYAKIIIAGHSEGSLIGMIAAKGNADAYISLAGAGRTIDEVIIEQMEKLAPSLTEEVKAGLVLLKKGETFELKNPLLAGIFRESSQPYMISWIKYKPQYEIKKLTIPVLLVNGTKDMQVKVTEAELLKQAKPDAKLELITNMNHLFKDIKGDENENRASYIDPNLPVMPELIGIVNQFIKSL